MPKGLSLHIFKIRTANHGLPVETDSWAGTPIYEWTLNLCQTNEIGSETHYIFEYSFYIDKQFFLENKRSKPVKLEYKLLQCKTS